MDLGLGAFKFLVFRQNFHPVDLNFEQERAKVLFRNTCYNILGLRQVHKYLDTPVEIEGLHYANLTAAATELNLSAADVYFQCRSVNFPSWQFNLGKTKRGHGILIDFENPFGCGKYKRFSGFEPASHFSGWGFEKLRRLASSDDSRVRWAGGRKEPKPRGKAILVRVPLPEGLWTYFTSTFAADKAVSRSPTTLARWADKGNPRAR